MARTSAAPRLLVLLAALAVGAVLLPSPAFTQEEVASSIRRYKDREVSTGYYEEYEARPRRGRPFVEVPGVRWGCSHTAHRGPTCGCAHAWPIRTWGSHSTK
jgi:hypothetical protein